MFDVFYIGKKPGVVVHEKAASSLEDAQQQSRTRFCWIINYLSDYSDFDFLWEPKPWENHQTHAWPSEWHPDRCTRLMPRQGGQEINYHNEVIPIRPVTSKYLLDHGNVELQSVSALIHPQKTVRYVDNYLDTLRRIASTCNDEYIWVCSSICDYTNFDFTWRPNTWQHQMLHVFSDLTQRFGDTFLMHVPSFRERSVDCVLLDWYDLHYIDDIVVPRYPMPVIQHNDDTHVDVVTKTQWSGPLAVFTNCDYVTGNLVTVPLWGEKTKTIVPLDSGAMSVVVPKNAVPYIKTQLYDYPYIDKTKYVLKSNPLDIVFISNGEPNAGANYLQMTVYLANESRYTNRVHVVEGVNGRVAAYHAAARASTTPWFFAVFAKLEVNQRFDWTWQPDRMQQPKHYIFHAGNPVNGLVYGHQSMIAYNKKLVLETTGDGLDFTLEQPHEVVPIISGTANYAESPWMAWRTAFREVLKLQHSLPNIENEYRLKAWLREDSGTIANGHWSHKGAQDAVEYYNEVGGDFTALKKSYEWEWLASYAFIKRSLTPD